MRVGITVKNLIHARYHSLTPHSFKSGCSQHALMFITLLLKIGCTPVLVGSSTSANNESTVRHFHPIQICDCNDLLTLQTLDVILCPGLLLPISITEQLTALGIPVVDVVLGNMFTFHVWDLFHKDNNRETPKPMSPITESKCSETWISPHFEYTKAYYDMLFAPSPVLVMPYFWEPRFCMEKKSVMEFDTDNIRVAVMESNHTWGKNCMIPIVSCNLACDVLSSVHVFGLKSFLVDGTPRSKTLESIIHTTKLWKEKKMSIHGRHCAPHIFGSMANIVVSHVDSWDLNFLYLECFYLGIPLIHNSPRLKQFGFYYEGHNATQASNWIRYLFKNGFDRQAYIEKNKGALEQFDIETTHVTRFYEDRLLHFKKHSSRSSSNHDSKAGQSVKSAADSIYESVHFLM